MCFVKLGIQLLVMLKNFILLIVFNMPAHNNDSLPHEKHKETTEYGKQQKNKTKQTHFCYRLVLVSHQPLN